MTLSKWLDDIVAENEKSWVEVPTIPVEEATKKVGTLRAAFPPL
jgi:hypothetical protein